MKGNINKKKQNATKVFDKKELDSVEKKLVLKYFLNSSPYFDLLYTNRIQKLSLALNYRGAIFH